MGVVGGWVLGERLGAGAVGEVWATEDARGQAVALKLLRGGGAALRAEALRAEARIAARLSHPHIVTLHDMGEHEGQPYLVMELARHGSLAGLVGRLEWGVLGALVAQLLRGLGRLHAAGLLHLDLKPANALLTSEAGQLRAMLSDLGMAGLEEAGGTPAYMAPEQRARARHQLGPWTDLYALGITVWELVAGRRPEPGAPLTPLPGLDGLNSWLARMTCEAPLERFPSSAHALASLEALAPAWSAAPTTADLPAPGGASGAQTSLGSLGATTRGVSALISPTLPAPDAAAVVAARAALPALALPAGWSEAELAPRAAMAGLGAGLARLRELPLVGHEPARDALWAALRAADAGAVAVSLDGEEGCEALGRWAQEQAHALAGWRVLTLEERAGDAASVTMARALGQLMMPHGEAPRGALMGHMAAWLASAGVEPGLVAAMAQEAAGLLREASQGRGGLRPTQERVAQVARLLAQISASRPLVVLVPGWSSAPIARALCEALLGQPARVVVVCTGAGDAAPAGAARVEVGALEAAQIARLAREVLGVSRGVAESLALRVGGSPSFALEVLRAWSERGALVDGPTGLVLAEQAELPLPSSLGELWSERLDGLLGGRGGVALWGVAALGPRVSEALVAGVSEALGVAAPAQELEALARAGWLEREGDGWRFSQELSRRALLAQAEEAGELARVYGAAARALEGLGSGRALEIARCWRGAGQPDEVERALAPLVDVGFDAGGAYAMLEVLEGMQGSAQSAALKGRAWYAVGDNARAEEAIAGLDVAGLEGRLGLWVAVEELRVLLALTRGRPAEAMAHGEALVARRAALEGDVDLLARSLLAAGRAAIHHGELERAVGWLREVVSWREQVTPLLWVTAQLLCGVALTELRRLEESVEALEACMPPMRELGATTLLVSAVNTLGDVAIKRERWEEAERWLLEGVALCQERYPLACYPRGNLAWVYLRSGRHEEALRALDEGMLGAGPGVRYRAWLFMASLRPCALALLGRGQAWDEAMTLWEEGFAELDVAHEEAAQGAELAAQAWASCSDGAREARAWEAAARLWDRLGAAPQAELARSHKERTGSAHG
jgi:eukaryotic-like serine/threonine-protein kinase